MVKMSGYPNHSCLDIVEISERVFSLSNMTEATLKKKLAQLISGLQHGTDYYMLEKPAALMAAPLISESIVPCICTIGCTVARKKHKCFFKSTRAKL